MEGYRAFYGKLSSLFERLVGTFAELAKHRGFGQEWEVCAAEGVILTYIEIVLFHRRLLLTQQKQAARLRLKFSELCNECGHSTEKPLEFKDSDAFLELKDGMDVVLQKLRDVKTALRGSIEANGFAPASSWLVTFLDIFSKDDCSRLLVALQEQNGVNLAELLFHAVRCGAAECSRALIANRAAIGAANGFLVRNIAKDLLGRSTCYYAATHGFVEVLMALDAFQDGAKVDPLFEMHVIQVLIMNGHPSSTVPVKAFGSVDRDLFGAGLVDYAIVRRDLSIIQETQWCDQCDDKAFAAVEFEDNPLMLLAILSRSSRAVTVNQCHESLLHVACRLGRLDCAKALLSRDGQVNAVDGLGWTSLFHAARRGDAVLLRMLLAHRADPGIVDRTGWTAADHATYFGFLDLAAQLRADRAIPEAPMLKPLSLHAPCQQWSSLHASVADCSCLVLLFLDTTSISAELREFARARNATCLKAWHSGGAHSSTYSLLDIKPWTLSLQLPLSALESGLYIDLVCDDELLKTLHESHDPSSPHESDWRQSQKKSSDLLIARAALTPFNRLGSAGRLCVPLLDGRLDVVGTLEVGFQLVRSFSNLHLRGQPEQMIEWSSVRIAGHRGSGAENAARVAVDVRRTHCNENTILSFDVAALMGAKFVEFGKFIDQHEVLWVLIAIARRAVDG